MIRIFMTGDNHFGKLYDKWECKEKLLQSRFDSLAGMVAQAEKEQCNLFVVTGDLFDKTYSIRVSDVKKIAEILSRFPGPVLVLPGNHDFYTGEEEVWKNFLRFTDTADNIRLLTENRKIRLEVHGEALNVYPAPCASKQSGVNNLDWIKEAEIDEGEYNIGIAHGAVEGMTVGEDNYFPMTMRELEAIPVDAWLLGHTHVPFPQLGEKDETGHRVFNAGTHEQPDRATNTPGYGFILTLDRQDGRKTVSARSWQSGRMHFPNLTCEVRPGEHLEEALDRTLAGLPRYEGEYLLHVEISGAVAPEEYENRTAIYEKKKRQYLDWREDDSKLAPIITREKIRAEYPQEISLAARLLEELLADPKEAQMAYDLLKEVQK